MNNTIILVFVGGAVGAILREFLMLTVGIVGDGFPLDLFVANVGASLLIGIAYSATARHALSDNANVFVSTGILGGLSTFSSFALASEQLFARSGSEVWIGAAFAVGSIVAGFIAVLLGMRIGAAR